MKMKETPYIRYSMLFSVLSILLFLFQPKEILAQHVANDTIKLALMVDNAPYLYEEDIQLFRSELDLILGAAHHINLPDEYILSSYAERDSVEANYERLLADEQVDIIICVGLLTGTLIGQKKEFPKPVIIYGIEDPVVQGIVPAPRTESGIHNMTYVVTTESFERDISVFKRFIPFQNLGVVVDPEVIDILPLDRSFLDTLQELGDLSLTILPSKLNSQAFLDSLPPEVDALFLGYHSNLIPDDSLKKLIDGATEMELPTFATTGELVRKGALASNTPDRNTQKIVRRIVLDVESILDGVDPADLPVILDIKEKLIVNVQTMRRLGFAPSYKVLSQAELVDQFELDTDRTLSLVDVLKQVQENNIELRAFAQGVRSQARDIRIEESDFFPFATAFTSAATVDNQSVSTADGVTEYVLNSILTIRQLIFSEQDMGEITVEKYDFLSEAYAYESFKLDQILRAGEAYFEILRAKNILRIAQDNWKLTQENLELAAAREEVGYSDASDVFRWESNLRQATSTVIGAQTNLQLTKIRLNLLLNRPYNEIFRVEESNVADSLIAIYFDQTLLQYLYDPQSLAFFSDFLTREGILNSPDIKSIDAQLGAQTRFMKLTKRTRYIPTTDFTADFFYTILRGGAGTEAIIDPNTGLTVDPDFGPNLTYVLSINATLPFLQGGRIHHLTQKAKIDILQLDEQRRQFILDIQDNVSASLRDATVNAYNLTLTREAAEFSNKAYGMVKASYSNGQSLFVDLLNAQNEVLLANLAAANAVYDYLISLLNVDRAISSFAILRAPDEEQAMRNRFDAFKEAYGIPTRQNFRRRR